VYPGHDSQSDYNIVGLSADLIEESPCDCKYQQAVKDTFEDKPELRHRDAGHLSTHIKTDTGLDIGCRGMRVLNLCIVSQETSKLPNCFCHQ
jgi:hypothetical protein